VVFDDQFRETDGGRDSGQRPGVPAALKLQQAALVVEHEGVPRLHVGPHRALSTL
jgi:hypothetical protein